MSCALLNRRRVRREVAVVPVEAAVSVDEMLVAESVRDSVVVVMLDECECERRVERLRCDEEKVVVGKREAMERLRLLFMWPSTASQAHTPAQRGTVG